MIIVLRIVIAFRFGFMIKMMALKMAEDKTPVIIMLVIIFIFPQQVRRNPQISLRHSKAIDSDN